jgi:hypothetical protein
MLSQVAMDNSGNAIAVWKLYNGVNIKIQSSVWDSLTSTWTPTPDLSAPGQNVSDPQIAMDNSGNAISVWTNNTINTIQSSVWDSSTSTWTPTPDLSTPGQNANTSQIAMDASGNAISVWMGSDGTNNLIQSSRWNGSSWSTPADNLLTTEQYASSPQIAMNTSGDAFAVWYRFNDDENLGIQAAQFIAPTPPPPPPPPVIPMTLTASQKCYRYPTQGDLVHILNWSTVEGTAEYKIYLDANFETLVAKVPANITCFEFHRRCPGKSITYYVVAVDANGDIIVSASVTIDAYGNVTTSAPVTL